MVTDYRSLITVYRSLITIHRPRQLISNSSFVGNFGNGACGSV